MTDKSDHSADLASLLASSRADLHRYCARLTGSVFDGEDVVQDVMLRALAAAPSRPADLPLRPWLFRIAHNRSIDLLRARRATAKLSSNPLEVGMEDSPDPFEAAALRQAIGLAVDRFAELPTLQRSVLILKDVLDETNASISATLGLSLQSVKAHLHRGRRRIRELAQVEPAARQQPSPETLRFVEMFNARDWGSLQRLLAEDVRLVQTSKASTVGRAAVSSRFFRGYAASIGWRLWPGTLEGREVAWVEEGGTAEIYFMVLDWSSDELRAITDFRYARYVARDVPAVARG